MSKKITETHRAYFNEENTSGFCADCLRRMNVAAEARLAAAFGQQCDYESDESDLFKLVCERVQKDIEREFTHCAGCAALPY